MSLEYAHQLTNGEIKMNREQFKPTQRQIMMKRAELTNQLFAKNHIYGIQMNSKQMDNVVEKELNDWIDDQTIEAMQFQLDSDAERRAEYVVKGVDVFFDYTIYIFYAIYIFGIAALAIALIILLN